MNYKHTIIDQVLIFIDYVWKGFINGAYFDEKYIYKIYENKTKDFMKSSP